MGSWVRENTFVCLDDITCKMEEYNPVIYNPRIVTDIVDRKKMLYNYIQEALCIELTDEELESVCHIECSPTYNSSTGDVKMADHMLIDFILKMRDIIKTKRN